MSSELELRKEHNADHVKVFISGEIDIYTSQKLKEELFNLVDEAKMDLRIDCSGLDYIDSTGLGIFAGTLKRAKEYNRKIYVSSLRDHIKKLFVITGLDKILTLE